MHHFTHRTPRIDDVTAPEPSSGLCRALSPLRAIPARQLAVWVRPIGHHTVQPIRVGEGRHALRSEAAVADFEIHPPQRYVHGVAHDSLEPCDVLRAAGRGSP